MRTVTSLLASAVATMLLVSPVFSQGSNTQDVATKAIEDLITTLAAPEDMAKKLEGFTVKLDAVGCYNIKGPDGLSLKLCQDDKEARIPLASATNAGTYSWVKGSITNTGTTDICGIAFASKETDLVKDAIQAIPANLPVTTVGIPATETFDLAAGSLPVEFAFLLPLDLPTNTPSFVGLADSVKSCTAAAKPFVPKLVDATDAAVDVTAVTADQAVQDTTDALTGAAAGIQDMLKKTTTTPATGVTTPTTPTETTPTETTVDTPTTEKVEETPEAPVTPVVAPVTPPTVPVTKPVEKEIDTTAPAGILSHSLLFAAIAAASVMALFA